MEAVALYRLIGFIHTPFKDVVGMPIQPAGARGVAGRVIINEAYREGLKDLEGFSHVFLLYHLHLCDGYALQVKPFLDDALHGIFACRSPEATEARYGLSIVKLVRVEGPVLHVEGVDVVDGNASLLRRQTLCSPLRYGNRRPHRFVRLTARTASLRPARTDASGNEGSLQKHSGDRQGAGFLGITGSERFQMAICPPWPIFSS